MIVQQPFSSQSGRKRERQSITEPTTAPSIGSILQWISASEAMNWRGPKAGASSVKIHGTTSSGVLGRAAMTQ